MATSSQISVEEYLRTVYRPDRDYVDGVVVERNLGEKDHSKIQALLVHLLMTGRRKWGIHVYPEQRVQVKPTRFRIPDLCVYAGEEPDEQVFTTPPLICIEILSPEDRWSRVQERITDYLHFGVPYIWIIGPAERKAWHSTTAGISEVTELSVVDPPIRIGVGEIFE